MSMLTEYMDLDTQDLGDLIEELQASIYEIQSQLNTRIFAEGAERRAWERKAQSAKAYKEVQLRWAEIAYRRKTRNSLPVDFYERFYVAAVEMLPDHMIDEITAEAQA